MSHSSKSEVSLKIIFIQFFQSDVTFRQFRLLTKLTLVITGHQLYFIFHRTSDIYICFFLPFSFVQVKKVTRGFFSFQWVCFVVKPLFEQAFKGPGYFKQFFLQRKSTLRFLLCHLAVLFPLLYQVFLNIFYVLVLYRMNNFQLNIINKFLLSDEAYQPKFQSCFK